MQIILRDLEQSQSSNNSETYTEPNFKVSNLVIKVTGLSVNLLGSVVFKLQHSFDGSDWIDVPGLTTGAISVTGVTTLSIDPEFSCFDHLRLAWTFNNANSVTFYGVALGTR